MRPSSDPAGLLERIPELEILCNDASVRRSIERGDAFALYRALVLGRLLGRFSVREAEVAKDLASQRRLFAKPLSSAPWLFTLNGVGASIYGDDERGDDGAYVKTHFLVLVFVPVFPLGAYLVADGENGGWSFFGRVPFGPITWAWNRLAVLAALIAVLAGIGTAVEASLYSTVYVVNGLDQPVRVRIGDEWREVPPRAGLPETFVVSRAPQEVETQTLDGRTVETGHLDATGRGDALVWNVLGAAPVYEQDVIYAAAAYASGSDPAPRVHCGETAIAIPRVDDAFTEPPASVSLSSSTSRVTRIALGIAPDGFDGCVSWLLSQEQGERAVALVRTIAVSSGWQTEYAWRAIDVTVRARDRAARIDIARAWRDAVPAELDAHRAYGVAMRDSGRGEEVRADYEQRLAADPTSLDAQYLLLRLLPGEEGMRRAQALLAAHPEHVPTLRALGYLQLQSLAFADAERAFREAVRLEPDAGADVDPQLALALMGSGDASGARELISARFAATGSSHQVPLAILYARLGADDPRALFDRMEPAASGPPLEDVWFRLWARMPVGESELSALSPFQRAFAQVHLAALVDPDSALALVGGLSPTALGDLDDDLWALLYAEACRRGAPQEAVLATATGAPTASAIAAYVRDGTESPDLDGLTIGARAAIDLVRSRVTSLSPEVRQALVDRAARGDVLGDGAARAAQSWPPA